MHQSDPASGAYPSPIQILEEDEWRMKLLGRQLQWYPQDRKDLRCLGWFQQEELRAIANATDL